MRRFALAIVIGFLAFSASGVSALVIAEPCTIDEQPGQVDSDCSPTCVTCGCCPQAVEPVTLPLANSPEAPVAAIDVDIPRAPQSRAREVLHVPKLQLA